MKINVLGTEYEIKEVDSSFNEKFKTMDAWCDTSIKKIYICKLESDKDSKEDLEYVKQKILRHELIHAFIYESGLDTESSWALNEVIVDFFAIQIPKMMRTFDKANAI